MNVDIFHNTYHISNIAGGKKQEEIFESGKLYIKVSDNVYFNRGEILECVGFHEGEAYFTCERLRYIHEGRFRQNQAPLAGINLREGEVLEFFDQDLLAKNLKKEKIEKLKRINKNLSSLVL